MKKTFAVAIALAFVALTFSACSSTEKKSGACCSHGAH